MALAAVAAVALFGFGFGATGPDAADPAASVALVRSAGGNGSGWVAAADMVVTNWHVARGGTGDIYVDFADGERQECYTVAGDPDMDLGVLRCPTGDREPFALKTAVPDAGTPVTVIGYPESIGPTTTTGVITGERVEVRGIPTIGFTAEIRPGSSGSPVFDEDRRVRGVATFGGGLGVPSSYVQPLLDTAAGYPLTKEGAEWQLRGRRSAVAALVLLPVGFVVARRRGRSNVLPTMVRLTVGGILAVLALTQLQFALTGPAHLI